MFVLVFPTALNHFFRGHVSVNPTIASAMELFQPIINPFLIACIIIKTMMHSTAGMYTDHNRVGGGP